MGIITLTRKPKTITVTTHLTIMRAGSSDLRTVMTTNHPASDTTTPIPRMPSTMSAVCFMSMLRQYRPPRSNLLTQAGCDYNRLDRTDAGLGTKPEGV